MDNTNLAIQDHAWVKTNYEQAIELHCQVMVSREVAINALSDFAKYLKAMRDGKLYSELGYETFDSYVEKEVHVGIRQVYKYISSYENLGSTVLQSNAHLGIEKLAMLGEIPDIERADFIDNNDLDGMSTREIRALIEKSKNQEEQISLLLNSSNDDNAHEEVMQKKIDQLTVEVDELRNRPIEVAVEEPSKVDLEKIRQQIEAEVKDKFEIEKKQVIKDTKEKAESKAKKDLEKQIADAKSEGANEATEKMKSTLSGLEESQAKLIEKTNLMEKELSVKGDAEVVKVMCIFANLKNNHEQIIAGLKDVAKTDIEKAGKLALGIATFMANNAIPELKELEG